MARRIPPMSDPGEGRRNSEEGRGTRGVDSTRLPTPIIFSNLAPFYALLIGPPEASHAAQLGASLASPGLLAMVARSSARRGGTRTSKAYIARVMPTYRARRLRSARS